MKKFIRQLKSIDKSYVPKLEKIQKFQLSEAAFADLFKNDRSLFSSIDNTNPYAAVAPIKGAPLTSIIFIAFIASLTVLSSLIINLCGSFV